MTFEQPVIAVEGEGVVLVPPVFLVEELVFQVFSLLEGRALTAAPNAEWEQVRPYLCLQIVIRILDVVSDLRRWKSVMLSGFLGCWTPCPYRRPSGEMHPRCQS